MFSLWSCLVDIDTVIAAVAAVGDINLKNLSDHVILSRPGAAGAALCSFLQVLTPSLIPNSSYLALNHIFPGLQPQPNRAGAVLANASQFILSH